VPHQRRGPRDLRAGASEDGGDASFTSAERLQISAKNERTQIYVRAGEGSRDLLHVLGLEEGVVRKTVRDRKGQEVVPKEGKTYGLRLAKELRIDTPAELKRTSKEFEDAMTVLQGIYRDLSRPAGFTPVKSVGEAPAHMRAQLANYEAGLAQLTGGNPGVVR